MRKRERETKCMILLLHQFYYNTVAKWIDMLYDRHVHHPLLIHTKTIHVNPEEVDEEEAEI